MDLMLFNNMTLIVYSFVQLPIKSQAPSLICPIGPQIRYPRPKIGFLRFQIQLS